MWDARLTGSSLTLRPADTYGWIGSEIRFTDCDNGRVDAVKKAAYSVSSGRLACSH